MKTCGALKGFLKQQYAKTSLPVLLVSVCTLLVAITGLTYSISGYYAQRRANRPLVRVALTNVEPPTTVDAFVLAVYFQNVGHTDAVSLKFRAITIRPKPYQTRLLASGELSRLRVGERDVPPIKLKSHISDVLDYIAICISYTDDRADVIEPDITLYTPPPNWRINGLSKATASQQDALSPVFSCAQQP
jgi:hypothetical protein